MEGVERYKVKLIPHNQKWEEEFLTVREEVRHAWGDNLLDIQHVGSTAIRSICAKPILDIAVQLKSIKNMDIVCLELLGYSYCGPQNKNPNYHLFVLRGNNEISLRHIHCYDREENEFNLLVGFRDYLNTHIDDAMRYEKLKRKLSEEYPDDRIAYTRGKESFILSIYGKL